MGSFSHFLQLRKKLEDLLFFMSGYKDFSQAEVAKVSQIYRAIFHITLQPVAINRTRSLDITTRCSSVYIYLLTLVVFNLTFAFRMMSEWMLLLKIGQMQWRVEWKIVASSSFWMPSSIYTLFAMLLYVSFLILESDIASIIHIVYCYIWLVHNNNGNNNNSKKHWPYCAYSEHFLCGQPCMD